MMPIYIATPRLKHTKAFIQAAKRSKALHKPWVNAPTTTAKFKEHVLDENSASEPLFLIFTEDGDEIVGSANINGVVMGIFKSAYLGYYAFEPHAGKGLMSAGISKVLSHAFNKMKLHRLEANIQPENKRSIALVKRLGFTKEGYSRRYLKIRGKWQDHERWAILKEDWEVNKK